MKANEALRAVCSAVLVAVAASAARGAIIAGPYLQKVDTDPMGLTRCITVMWETDTAGNSYVDYGLTTAYAGSTGNPTLVTLHEVEVTGLSVDTEYHYRVKTGVTMSSDAVFRTSPAKGSTNFQFIAYGDSRTNECTHTEVALAMDVVAERTFILNSGDIVPLSTSDGSFFREDFFGPLLELCRETPIFVSRGNHEATNPYFVDYLAHPDAVSASEDYFSFDYGNVHVIALDSNQSLTGTQRTWLTNDLQIASGDSDIDWIIVVFHTPPYSTGVTHGENKPIQDEWCPLFETYGVDLVFNGDDHCYQRIKQQGGVVYIVTGGGGAGLYDQISSPPSWCICYHKLNNFVTIDVTDTTLKVVGRCVRNAGYIDGDLIDSVVIRKGSPNEWSPTAKAGPDQIVDAGTQVTLDGTGSYDGDGDSFTYTWSQLSGPSMTLSSTSVSKPTFTPQYVGVYVFQLVCTEGGDLDSVPDTVRIGVKNPATGDVTATLLEDTCVWKSMPTDNYGSETTLDVDADETSWAGATEPAGTTLAYLLFDVPAFEGAVLEAKLRLYGTSTCNDTGGYVRTSSDVTWDESVVTYNNRPPIDGPSAGVIGTVSISTWVEVDVATAITGPGKVTLAIIPNWDDGYEVSSKEGSNQPQLIIKCTGPTQQPPTCSISADPVEGVEPLQVDFTATASDDGAILLYEWDFSYDGTTFNQEDTGQTVSHTFNTDGTYTVALRVTDNDDMTAEATITITVWKDSDSDGMPDWWEDENGLDKDDPSDAGDDPDGDNLTNLQEFELRTDPNDPDTDGDGLQDDVDPDPLNPPQSFFGCGLPGVALAAAAALAAFIRRRKGERR